MIKSPQHDALSSLDKIYNLHGSDDPVRGGSRGGGLSTPSQEVPLLEGERSTTTPSREDALSVEDFVEEGQGLYNNNDTQYNADRKKELPYHRTWILMRAQGHSCIEIAKKTGYHVQTVREVLNQPWAKARVLQELEKNGRDEVLNIFQSSAADLAWDLVEIAQNKEEKGSVRVTAIQSIHDRLLGKAVQPLQHQNLDTKNLSDSQLLAELEKIKKTGAGTI